MPSKLNILIAVLALVLPLIASLSAISFASVSPPKEEVKQCDTSFEGRCTMTLDLKRGDHVSGTVSVSNDSGNRADFWIADPSGATVYKSGIIHGGGTLLFTAYRPGAYVLTFEDSLLSPSKQITVVYAASPRSDC